MTIRRARLYDIIALCTALAVIVLDQWTKALVVANLSPAGSKNPISLIGEYLVIYYIQNKGAAFGMFFSNSVMLAALITVAIVVVAYLYLRLLNRGPLIYKIVFGLIIGGAVGNLIDRAQHSGYVVDFLSFRIPQLNFYFAIFNIADACISIGVCLLFILVLLGGFRRSADAQQQSQSTVPSGSLRPTEQDAQH
ncbi:MAG TPA: signal peptidase II [Ktedonobacteraceae bacterium]|jgi:signal peptidase II